MTEHPLAARGEHDGPLVRPRKPQLIAETSTLDSYHRLSYRPACTIRAVGSCAWRATPRMLDQSTNATVSTILSTAEDAFPVTNRTISRRPSTAT